MTKLAIMFFLSSTMVMAGTVHFNPPSATITPGAQSVSFDVSVSWETLPTIDTVNVLVQADEGVSLEFDYAQAFVSSATIIPDDSGCYDCDQFPWPWPPHVDFGGNNFSAAPWTSPLLIGTLTVTTSALQAGDVDRIRVDPTEESELFGDPAIYVSLLGSGAMFEPLRGAVTITVLPEPATLLGLAMGLTAIFSARRCRRKTTS